MNLRTCEIETRDIGTRDIGASAGGAWELTVIRPPSQAQRVEPPVVTFTVNRDTVQSFLERIIETLLPLDQFFRQQHRLWRRTPAGLRPVTVRTLPGLLVGCVELLFFKATPEGLKTLGYRVLSSELARAFLVSPALKRLPELDDAAPASTSTTASPAPLAERRLEPLVPLAAQFAGAGPAPATVWVERLEAAGLHRLIAGPLGERSSRGKATRLGRLFGGMLGVPFGSGEGRYELLRHYPRGVQGKPVYEISVCESLSGRRALDDV